MKTFKIILISFVCVVIACVIAFCSFVIYATTTDRQIQKQLCNIPQECAEPYTYVKFNTVYSNGVEIDISKICKNSICEIFCVSNSNIYFAYYSNTESDDKTHEWTIAKIDIQSKDMTDLYTLKGIERNYSRKNNLSFNEKCGYYLDGKIILNSKITVAEYDINNRSVKEYNASDYTFPKENASLHVKTKEDGRIQIAVDGQASSFSLSDMASKSESISAVYKLIGKKRWDGEACIREFFNSQSGQVVGCDIFAIGECFDYSGNAYAVILKYNKDNADWEYATSCYLSTRFSPNNCYVIYSE